MIKVQLSMPTYVPDAIKKIKRIFSGKPQYAPADHIPPKTGKIIQYSEPEDVMEALYKIQNHQNTDDSGDITIL